MPFRNPIFCALDRPDLEGALALAQAVREHVGGLKVGLEFVTACGPDGVRAVVGMGLPVFLDVKFHDIPNTVAGAVRSASGLGVAMLNVHASGGRAMIEAAVQAARSAEKPPLVLAVTVLTSLDDRDLEDTGIGGRSREQAVRLAKLAIDAGADGLVCSPLEIAAIREEVGPEPKLVVPGIRPAGAAAEDQKRTMTPRDALDAGADVLVIGRPITASPDPRLAAAKVADELRPLDA